MVSITSVCLLLLTCKRKEEPKVVNDTTKSKPYNNEITQEETYHADTSNQYEYRTGKTGNYSYNYDVSGTDNQGNEVSGNITMEGKYGYGTIVDSEGNEIEIEAEWINKGKLKANDDQENEYELEVD